jgi:ribosomal protein S21
MIRIEVKREGTESTGSALRRFSKKVQVANIVRKVKGLKAAERPLSHYKKKKAALKRLTKRAAYERLKKLGKLPNVPQRKAY